MVRAVSTWLLVPFVLAALIAGCGGSSKSSSSSSTATSSSVSTPSAASTAVAACKQGLQRLNTLSASTRAKLEEICDKAGSGDRAAVRKAAEEGCRDLVNASPLPNGPTKERALAACKRAAGK